MLQNMVQSTPFSVRVRRYLGRLAIQLPVFLALYVLSIGPMFWYWFGAFYADGPKFLFVLYYPLLLLCDKNEHVRDYINSYINWWIL